MHATVSITTWSPGNPPPLGLCTKQSICAITLQTKPSLKKKVNKDKTLTYNFSPSVVRYVNSTKTSKHFPLSSPRHAQAAPSTRPTCTDSNPEPNSGTEWKGSRGRSDGQVQTHRLSLQQGSERTFPSAPAVLRDCIFHPETETALGKTP